MQIIYFVMMNFFIINFFFFFVIKQKFRNVMSHLGVICCLLLSNTFIKSEPGSPLQLSVETDQPLQLNITNSIPDGTLTQWICVCDGAVDVLLATSSVDNGMVFYGQVLIPNNITCSMPNLTIVYKNESQDSIIHTKQYKLLGIVKTNNTNDVGVIVALTLIGMVVIGFVVYKIKTEVDRGTVFYAKPSDLTYEDIISDSSNEGSDDEEAAKPHHKDVTAHFHPRPSPENLVLNTPPVQSVPLDLSTPLLDDDLFDKL